MELNRNVIMTISGFYLCACSQASPSISVAGPTANTTQAFSQSCGRISSVDGAGLNQCATVTGGNHLLSPVGFSTCTGLSTQCWGLFNREGVGGAYVRTQALAPIGYNFCLGVDTGCGGPRGIETLACLSNCARSDITFLTTWNSELVGGPIGNVNCFEYDSVTQDPAAFGFAPCLTGNHGGTFDNERNFSLTGFPTAFATQYNFGQHQSTDYLSFDPETVGGGCGGSPAMTEGPSPAQQIAGIWQPTANNKLLMVQSSMGFFVGAARCGSYAGNDTWLSPDANGNMVWGPTFHNFAFVTDQDATGIPAAALLLDVDTQKCVNVNVVSQPHEESCRYGDNQHHVIQFLAGQ